MRDDRQRTPHAHPDAHAQRKSMPMKWLAQIAHRLAHPVQDAPAGSTKAATAADDRPDAQPQPSPRAARHVMIYATVDRDVAGVLRHDLALACGDEADLMRFAPIPGGRHVRVSLRLHLAGVTAATAAIARYQPGMEIMEVPATASTSWLDGLLARPIATAPTPAEAAPAGANPIADILRPEDVLLDVAAGDTAELFATIGTFVAQRHGLPAELVAVQLAERESGGTTAIGRGLAIPHARMKDLAQALALYLRPRTPIPFAAPDGRPVTDILVLLVPERASRQHLDLLAAAAQLFCDSGFREKLNESRDAAAVCRAFAAGIAAG
jgi:PTS system nitrogen regulatory IIA component